MARNDGYKSDVVISCSADDHKFAQQLTGSLRKGALDVCCLEYTKDQNTKTHTSSGPSARGQTILQCKVFVLVLSEHSAQDRQIKDELALAYISNKSVYPVALSYYKALVEHLDNGMKLMLAKINWTFFVKSDEYADTAGKLVTCITRDLESLKVADVAAEPVDMFEALNSHAPGFNFKCGVPPEETIGEEGSNSINCDFWQRHFNEQVEVTWILFRDAFLHDYGERIKRNYGEEKQRWFVQLLYKDVLVLRKVISRTLYEEFSGKNERANPDHFYERLKSYAIGSLAMREVFNMDSSVRLAAIQNLGSYQTACVVKLLFDLIEDPDANTRAVAALALAKTGKKTKKIEDKLIKLLSDEDRLVRESACLSLAHIRCTRAVPHIVDLWRNDPIKHVREATEVALNRIGGSDAAEAIHITRLLSEEMDGLRS